MPMKVGLQGDVAQPPASPSKCPRQQRCARGRAGGHPGARLHEGTPRAEGFAVSWRGQHGQEGPACHLGCARWMGLGGGGWILARWGFAGRVQHKVPSRGTAAWVGLGSAFLCWASRKETPSPLPAPQAPASITWQWEERGSGDAPTRVPLLPPHGIRTGRGGQRGAPACPSPLHGLSAFSKLHTHGEKPRQVPHTVGPSLSRCAGPELLWAEGSWPGR